MAEKRSLFKKIFGVGKDKSYTQFKLLSNSSSSFSTWDGNIYNNDIVRSCIRPKVSAVGKLHPLHVRTDRNGEMTTNPSANLKYLLRYPNPEMSMQKLLEKMMTQLELNHNAFAYVKKDKTGTVRAIYPILSVNVELLEFDDDIYAKFRFRNGQTKTVPYSDVIHLRKDFNDNDMYGSDGQVALRNLMQVIDTSDKGIVVAIRNSNVIKWLMKFKTVLRKEDKAEAVSNFTDSYLNVEKADGASVATTDPRYDLEQVTDESYVPNEKIIALYETRLKNYFGVSDAIIQNKFSEDEWNAFYEAEIEPIAEELSDQFTNKLFTKHEIECGNEIIFEASSLQFASMNTKLNLKDMVDRGAMNVNEWRRTMNLGSTENGDEFIRRLDTAPINDTKIGDENEK